MRLLVDLPSHIQRAGGTIIDYPVEIKIYSCRFIVAIPTFARVFFIEEAKRKLHFLFHAHM